MKLIPTSTQPVTITLYRGVPFDNNYNEHTLLSNKFYYQDGFGTIYQVGHDKEDFLNIKRRINRTDIYKFPRSLKSGTYNFAFGNGLVTAITLELTESEINSNYMKVTSGDDNYYYFITGVTQKNESTYLLNLELDVIMTFGEDFIDSIANKPVMVERKHCRRMMRVLQPTGDVFRINEACYNQESVFSQIRANIIKNKSLLKFKDYKYSHPSGAVTDFNDTISEMKWAYIVYEGDNDNVSYYTENKVTYPFRIFVFPLQRTKFIQRDIPYLFDFNPQVELMHWIGDPKTLKIIISPFPPFKECDNVSIIKNGDIYEFYLGVTNEGQDSTHNWIHFFTGKNNTGSEITIYVANTIGAKNMIRLVTGYGGNYNYTEIENYFDDDVPTITSLIEEGEYKLQIAPFKDLRMSSYYGGEHHIHTQLLFTKFDVFNSSNNIIKPTTIANTNGEANSYYDYCIVDGYDLSGKRGLSNSVAYNLPTSTSATELFNATQKNQFETSKNNATLSNGLKIVGGTLLGLAGGVVGKAAGAKLAMGSLIGVAGGISGEIQNIETHNAKLRDLENTPDNYSFSGSAFSYDYAMSISDGGNLLPYMLTYTCDSIRYNTAKEFLYHYGYEYNNESFFNTRISWRRDEIFERQVFNYVKLREDITSKLVSSNMPLIVAKKFNEILNAGIKFWTFFNMSMETGLDGNNILDNYFQKSIFCDAELVEDNL